MKLFPAIRKGGRLELQKIFSELEAEAKKCIACGKCKAFCPIYDLFKNEAFVTRGKVFLTKKIISGELKIAQLTATIFEHCLLCRKCQEECPAGMKIDQLILKVRFIIGFQGLKGKVKLLFLRSFFYYRFISRSVARLLNFLQGLPGWNWLYQLARKLFPLFGVPFRIQPPRFQWPPALKKFGGLHLPTADSRGRVLLFVGCGANYFYPQLVAATIKLLNHCGFELLIPENQFCNGTPLYSSGDFQAAKRLLQKNFKSLSNFDFDYLLTICPSCAWAFRERGIELFSNEAYRNISKRVFEIHEFLLSRTRLSPDDFTPLDQVVTFHQPCHLGRYLLIKEQPEILLQKFLRAKLCKMEDSDRCCGGAGTYGFFYNRKSLQLTQRKIDCAAQTGATILVTTCPSCVLQFEECIALNRAIFSGKVRFVLDLLAANLITNNNG